MLYFENSENISENQCRSSTTAKSGATKGQENVLHCANFQESLHLEFGKVPLKGSKTINFTLKNPSMSKTVQISTVHASKTGLTVSIESAIDNIATILPLQSCDASLTWTPIVDSTLREIIRFKMDDRGSLQVIAEGIAGNGKEEIPKKRQSLDNIPIKTVAKKNSTVRQSLSVVSSTKPELAKDMQWVEKQATTFVDWMNFKFAESLVIASTSAASECDPSPISDLTKKQQEARTKQEAIQIIRSSDFASVMQLIETEVLHQKLQLREDREILQDLGLQEAFFGILFSYELTWLCLGLEVVTSKSMRQRPYENSPRAKAMVKAFVMEHFFNNAAILARFPSQPGLYMSMEKKLKSQMKRHLLTQFLMLILFLDRGRSSNVLPLKSLFVRESIYKSSKDVLISFCRCFLHGEGDIIKHLGLIGYHVNFTQTYIDEINYNVSNLASDLRDGVRLALLVDILTRSSEVTGQLRVPAVSRLQKLHNVAAVLKQLFPEGNAMIESKHIVDGNRDKTLFLLWNIMYTFELRTILNAEQIEEEVRAISAKNISSAASVPDVSSVQVSADSEIVSALLAWCNAVAMPQGVVVKNLTNSLVDGKALCLLIKHYHPSLMNNAETTQETQLKESKHISEQRRNFNAIVRACKSIGGIPPLLYELDSKADEKTMLIFMGHLFVRLTESARQVKASTKLQRFFRFKRSNVTKQYTGCESNSTAMTTSRPRKQRDSSFPEHTIVWNEAPTTFAATVSPAVKAIEDEAVQESAEQVISAVDVPIDELNVPKTFVASDAALVELKEEVKLDLQSKLDTEKQLLESVVAQLETSSAAAEALRAAEEEKAAVAAKAAAQEALRLREEAERASAVAAALAEKEAASLRALLMAETCLKSESEARVQLEMRVKAEVEARLALEERLRQIEQKNIDLVTSMQRKEALARLAEFTRRRSVRLISSHWLAYRTRVNQMRALRGTVKLQAIVRRDQAQRKYLCLILAIQILQSSWRRKRCARLLVCMEVKAVIIQKAWVKHHKQTQAVKRVKSATVLCSWWRTIRQVSTFRAIRSTVVKVQSLARAYIAQSQFRQTLKNICVMQRFFRRRLAVKHTAIRRLAVKVLERSYTAFKFRSAVHTAFAAQRQQKLQQQRIELECRQKIFGFVQAVLVKRKRVQAVATISRWFLAMLPLVRVRKLTHGFTRLSAVHRANTIRLQNASNVSMAYSLKRIREAELKSQLTPSLRLGQLTQKALQSLCIGSIISDLLKSCQVLEMATEYSEECCDMFVSAKKVDILFGLLRSCNRSESHQELLRTVLVVLLHIARVERLAIAVGDSCEVTDSLVDLLQMFRDKKYLFKLACELLIRFVRASPTVKSTCMSMLVFKRLEGIYHIMERKDRLESRLRSIDSRASASAGYCNSSSSSASDCRKSLETAEPILYIQHLMSLLQ